MSLILFTSSFPYGKGEQFLETEIKYLAKEFDTITIVPTTYGKDKKIRQVPDNVKIESVIIENKFNRIFNIGFIKLIKKYKNIKIIIKELFKSLKVGQFKLFLKEFNLSYTTLSKLFIQDILKKSSKEDILYFYWGHGQSYILPFIEDIKAKKVFRVHRGDLYEYLNNDYLPFREHQLKACDNILPISSDGKKYLETKYPDYKNKIKLFRLGTLNHDLITPHKNNEFFHIISCSSLIEVKRVHLIIDILKNIKDLKIKWTHFGAGQLKESLVEKSKGLSQNIEVDFKGFVQNTKVLEFYASEQIDLFINVSSSEGIPVSIMEVLSYGIPVIATDVGGTSEAIVQNSGILIKKDFDVAEVSNVICKIINKEIIFEKVKVKEFWNATFNAEKNYTDFSKCLKSLGK
jgi:glycosyltransferase involved in cell wall biosynthesis